MWEIFELIKTVSCPLKDCKGKRQPSDEELKNKLIDLKNLEQKASELNVDPEDLFLIAYYGQYLTSEVYILPNLFNNHQDETILWAKANVGAEIFKTVIFGNWGNHIVA